jgi:hypothetical protein
MTGVVGERPTGRGKKQHESEEGGAHGISL